MSHSCAACICLGQCPQNLQSVVSMADANEASRQQAHTGSNTTVLRKPQLKPQLMQNLLRFTVAASHIAMPSAMQATPPVNEHRECRKRGAAYAHGLGAAAVAKDGARGTASIHRVAGVMPRPIRLN